MKRFLLAVMICVVTGLGWAASPQVSLTPVRQTHQQVRRHRAHKAVRHRAPKRRRHTV